MGKARRNRKRKQRARYKLRHWRLRFPHRRRTSCLIRFMGTTREITHEPTMIYIPEATIPLHETDYRSEAERLATMIAKYLYSKEPSD